MAVVGRRRGAGGAPGPAAAPREGGGRPLRGGPGPGRARGLQLGSTVSGCARRGRAGEARRGPEGSGGREAAARREWGRGEAEVRRGRVLNGSVSRCGRGPGQAALQRF